MHVALVSATIDPTTADGARDHLMNEVLPMVKAAPGLIAGDWTHPGYGRASSVIFSDTVAHAGARTPHPRSAHERWAHSATRRDLGLAIKRAIVER